VFDYDEFPPVPAAEWEGSELRHAVALAGILSTHVGATAALSPEEPVQEDFGAVLGVAGPEGITDIFISFYPRGSSDFTWALQFRRRRRSLRALFFRGDDDRIVRPVKDAIANLVASQPDRYKNPEWLEPSKL